MTMRKKRYKLHSVKEILRFPSPEWRVSGILQAGAFAMLYAPQEQGKTFVALDLALSIASGKLFHGRRVKQGAVVYVLGEGGGGLKNRVAAWLKEHGLEDVSDVFFVLSPVQFHRKDDVAAIRESIADLNIAPAMVVIDTFARCSVGVKENDATEMGLWIDAIRELQEEMKVDILALHHSTKPSGKKEPSERGSTAFIGAADTAIRLKRLNKTITVICAKQKDAEHFEKFPLHMKEVQVGKSVDGEPMTSCVLVAESDPRPANDMLSGHRKMLSALARFPNQTAARREWLAAANLRERTFDRRRDELLDRQFIEAAMGLGVYRVTEAGILAIATESPIDSHDKVA
jgi:AAA domain-containing protein